MAAGAFIYWFGWIWWIIVTFFWKKTIERLFMCVAILIFLSVLPLSFTIYDIKVSFGYLLFVLFICVKMKDLSIGSLLAHSIFSWCVCACYSGIQLLFLYDPIFTIVSGRLLVATMIGALSFLVANTFHSRLLVGLSGFIQGDILVTFVIGGEVGNLIFFDCVALFSLLYGVVWCFIRLSGWLNLIIETKHESPTFKQSS